MSDILSSASLLLAVLAVLYGLWYPEITKALEIKPPIHKQDAKGDYKKARAVLHNRAIPLSVSAFTLTSVFSPDAATILWSSIVHFKNHGLPALIDYDAVATSFVLVTFFSGIFTLHLARLTFQLKALVKKLNPAR